MSEYLNQKLSLLIENVHNHVAWNAQISEVEAEELLNSYPTSTYLLRSGENEFHYYFSYVSADNVVRHKSIRINTQSMGYYPNGGTGCNPNNLYHNVEDLIKDHLKCSCIHPLQNCFKQVQGF